ncbi:MAG TPA: hypothetical protein VFM55_26475 [Micromonosporaceae bacterium]|nr:hypothetical protein [Micromonosporaceae bacterium]
MTMLLLTNRRILPELTRWFPDSREELVVVTLQRALDGLDPATVGAWFRAFEVVPDYESPGVESLAAQLCARYGVRRILTTSEGDIVRAARLRDRLGLPGQDLASATAYRDKFVMKSLASAAGVPVAPMRMVHDPGELAGFVARQGLPVVVKLPEGKGSIGQSVLTDASEVAGFCRWWRENPQPFLAEGWVAGPAFHVDGLMDGGEVLLSWPSCYVYTQWQTRHDSLPFISGMLPAEHPGFAPLQELTAAVIGTLPPPPGMHPFHAEVFLTGGGEYVFCEIACRAGGGLIVDEIHRAFGVQLQEAGLKGQAGRQSEIRIGPLTDRYGHAVYAPQRGRLRHLPASCPVEAVVAYSTCGVVGRAYQGARSSTDEVASALMRLRGPDPLAELSILEDWWNGAVEWDLSTMDAALVTAGRRG